MRIRRRILAAAGLAICASTAAYAMHAPDTAREGRATIAHEHSAEMLRRDVLRIQAHLQTVERELLARDVSHLTPEQRAARARHIRVLRAYRAAGKFPHNHDHPGERVPYFRDAHGTLCAMAYLIEQSGEKALVERVARTNNNAYVRELASDPDLLAWLDQNGISAAEAARIQPAYEGDPCCVLVDDSGTKLHRPVTAVAVAAQAGVVTWNLIALPKRSLTPGLIGVVSGSICLGLGMSAANSSDRDHRKLATLNYAVGGTTVAVGLLSVVRALTASSTPNKPVGETQEQYQWTPLLGTDLQGRTQIGLTIRL